MIISMIDDEIFDEVITIYIKWKKDGWTKEIKNSSSYIKITKSGEHYFKIEEIFCSGHPEFSVTSLGGCNEKGEFLKEPITLWGL